MGPQKVCGNEIERYTYANVCTYVHTCEPAYDKEGFVCAYFGGSPCKQLFCMLSTK